MIVFTTTLLFKGSNLPVGLKNGEWLISSYHNHFKKYSFQKTLADIYPELKMIFRSVSVYIKETKAQRKNTTRSTKLFTLNHMECPKPSARLSIF